MEQWYKDFQKYKAIIKCPICNAKHYPVRYETKRLHEFGEYDVLCNCGQKYKVKMGTMGVIIRRNRDDLS